MPDTSFGRYAGLVPSKTAPTTKSAAPVIATPAPAPVAATTTPSTSRFASLIPDKTKTTTAPKAAAPAPAPAPDFGRFASLVPAKPAPAPVKPKGPSLVQKASEFIAGAAEAPTYKGTENSWGQTMKNLPGEIVRTILPGAAALNDNPELAKDITNKDVLKEVPKATFETAVAPAASYLLTFYGATSKLLQKAGMSPAPGTDKDGAFRLSIPGLGDVTNIQGRIAKDYQDKPVPSTAFSTGLAAAKYTGEEFLNGLFAASLAAKVVNPRISPVTPKGNVNVPEGMSGGEGPKTGQLYEGKVYQKPVAPEVFDKITSENSIPVRTTYDPKLPIYFEYTGSSPTSVTGRFVQVKPSYLETFMNQFKGDITKVPPAQFEPVAEATKSLSSDKLEMKQYYPSTGQDLPLSDAEFATIQKENPGLVDLMKSGKAPAIPVRQLADGNFESNGDGATRLIIAKHLNLPEVSVTIEGQPTPVTVPTAKIAAKLPPNIPVIPPAISQNSPVPPSIAPTAPVAPVTPENVHTEAFGAFSSLVPEASKTAITEATKNATDISAELQRLGAIKETDPAKNAVLQTQISALKIDLESAKKSLPASVASRIAAPTTPTKKSAVTDDEVTKINNVMAKSASLASDEKRGAELTPEEESGLASSLEKRGLETIDVTDSEGFVIQGKANTPRKKIVEGFRAIQENRDASLKIKTDKTGHMILYHGTNSAENLESILKDGFSDESGKVYFSTLPGKEAGGVGGAQEYGDHIVEVHVDPKYVGLNGLSEFVVTSEDAEKAIKSMKAYSAEKPTQEQAVKSAVKAEPKSIKQVAEETGIKEPNIRRILGVGVKKGVFERVDEGVYVLNNGKEDIAYVHTASAVDALPRLAEKGVKVDMVFLDIPYDTPAVKGGNRGVNYNLISVADFKKVVAALSKIVKDDNTPVYYMFSRAESGLKKMLQYNQVLTDAGFKVIAEGKWAKLFKSGAPVTNVRGQVSKPEGILLLNKSGAFSEKEATRNLDFSLVRPKGYQTEKPAELLNSLILQGTNKGDTVLDPFAGSGVAGAEAVKTGRKAILIEKDAEVADKLTKPRVESALERTARQKKELAEKGETEIDLSDLKLNKDGTFSLGGNMSASIGKFRDGTPINMGQIDKVKPIELPEMVQLAKDLMGDVPKIREKVSRAFGGEARGVFKSKDNGEIRLRADLFDPKVNSIDQAAKTLAHEIGHLIDYLPDHTLARGNLLGRLSTLKEFRKEFLPEAGITRSNEDIKTELWNFSKYWKPIDEETASKGYLEYRKSGKEVYADFISGLFNDPAAVQEIAPTAYNVFFQMLDAKPAVKDAYFDLQAQLHGERESIIKVRRQGVQKMFEEGDMKSVDFEKRLQLEREARKRNSLEALRFNLVDNNTPMIDRVKKIEKSGVNINPDEDPRYMLEERNYLSGLIKSELEKNVVPIYDELKKNGISWGEFGEALFYDRIVAGDRSAQANPRGITPDAAAELYDNLKKQAGDKWPVIQKSMIAFRGWLRDVAERAYKEGLYSPEMYAQMKANPAYVTFRVLDHIEDGVSSRVYKSIGTLKDITNPADASILKSIATIRATEKNHVVKGSVAFLKEHYPEEVEEAKSVFSGKGMRFIEPKKPDLELVTFKRGGKTEGYYVDEYIKHSLENDTIGRNNAIMKLIAPIRFMNRHLFRPLFIGYNPGFQAFNLIRDFKRFWKNTPDLSLANAFNRYVQAMPMAKVRAFGLGKNPSQTALEAYKLMTDLEASKVFGTTYTDFVVGEAHDESQIELVLRNSGIDSFAPDVKAKAWKKLLVPFQAFLNTIQKVGNYIETLPKAAGVYHLTEGDATKLTADQRSFIRKSVGSPDFLTRGYVSPVTNEIFLFSNSIAQGMRSDLAIATGPKTRSGFWWKTASSTFLPKLLMFMASVGLAGKWVKELMDNASEYDKANYTVVPLGKDSTGKAIYLRIPDDETGRLFGALLWKTLGLFDNTKPKEEMGRQLADIFSFLGGQIPSIAPTISTADDIYTYLSGNNPYDSYRGRLVLSDTLFKANDWDTDKAFIGYVFNQLGGGIFYRFGASGGPEVTGPLEEAVGLPVISNVFGRFVRVSDYGITETLNVVKAKEEQSQAQETIANRELVDKYVDQAIHADTLDYAARRALEVKMVEEKFGGRPKTAADLEKANSLITKFRVGLVKGVSGAEVDTLTTATSNAEKLSLLEAIKARLSDEDFAKLKDTVIKQKIVSSEVFQKLNNEK